MPRAWFTYIGNNLDRILAGSYVFAGSSRDSFECPVGSGEICAIYAIYSGAAVVGATHPTTPLSVGIRAYINYDPAFSVDFPLTGDVYLYVKDV